MIAADLVPTAQVAPNKGRRAIIDEYDDLERWYLANKPKLDRRKELGGQIQSWYEKNAADLAIREEGTSCWLDVSARKREHPVASNAKAFAALRKTIGLDKLVDSITITLKLLRAHLSDEQVDLLAPEQQTGVRTITVAPKPA